MIFHHGCTISFPPAVYEVSHFSTSFPYQSSSEKQNQQDVHIQRDRFTLRSWVTLLWSLGKSNVCKGGQQLETQEGVAGQVQRQSAIRNSFLLKGDVRLLLLRSLTDGMRNVHIMSSKKTPSQTSRITFDQIAGYHGPGKLTRKINHHTCQHLLFVLKIIPGLLACPGTLQ